MPKLRGPNVSPCQARSPLLLPLMAIMLLMATADTARVSSDAQTDEARRSRAGLCGPKGGTSEVEASKVSLSSEGTLKAMTTTYWVDPSDVPSCQKDAQQFSTELRSHRHHTGTAVRVWAYTNERDRPNSSDDSSGADSSASSSAVRNYGERPASSSSSSSAEATAAQILAVPVAIAGDANAAAGAVGLRRLLQAGKDIADAVVRLIDQYLDSSAASNAWPRERVTAVGLSLDFPYPRLLFFTVLYEGGAAELRTLTAQSVALVGDSRFRAQLTGVPFTTATVWPGTLTYDDNRSLEQLRLNLAMPGGQQVVVPAAAATPPSSPSTPDDGDDGAPTTTTPAATTTTLATATTTTPAATTTAGCDPNSCIADTTATEGWIFGEAGESCDSACSGYNANWECIASQLNTIDSADKLKSARADVFNCYFPKGYCAIYFNFYQSAMATAPYESGGNYYFLDANTVTTCAAEPSAALKGNNRLCFCKEKQ